MDTTVIDPSILATLASQAETVASEHDAATAAREAEIRASEELLACVIDRVRPALPALANRICIGYRAWPANNTQTADASDYAEDRGVYLGGDDPGPTRDYPRSNRGAYEGADLFLLRDGSFLRLGYAGHWSQWHGESCEWTSEAETLDTAQVAARYDVGALIERLAATLAKHVGTRAKATERMTSRASTLSAIATLARKGGK